MAADASVWRPQAFAKSEAQSNISQHATLYLTCFYPPFNPCPPTIVYSIYWQLPSTPAVGLPHPIKHGTVVSFSIRMTILQRKQLM